MITSMSDVTQVLERINQGDAFASEELLPLVYSELRKLAGIRMFHEGPGQTLSATALVHEAYLRLVDNTREQNWESKGHFFASAAEAMRRILINRARDKKRLKRGGDLNRIDLSLMSVATQAPDEMLLDLDESIQRLEKVDSQSASLVKLRFFAGLSMKDAAASLGLTRRQGDRLWAFGRAWLFDDLNPK